MNIQQMAIALSDAKKIVVLTGAGMSTASGLSDFRSNGGLWDGRDPLEISHPSKIGTPEFLEFFQQRIVDVKTHHANEGHFILDKWQKERNLSIVTQNIDGYHGEQAIEMHGHLRYLSCDTCGRRFTPSFYLELKNDTCPNPHCKEGHVRPNVTLFGEDLDVQAWTQAMGEVLTADFILVLGTSLEVRPFSDLMEIAFSNRARTAVITKSDTPYDGKVSFRSHEDIVTVLKELDWNINQYEHEKNTK